MADAVRIERVGDLPVGPEIFIRYRGGSLDDGLGVANFGGTSLHSPSDLTFTVTNLGTSDLTLADPLNLPPGYSLIDSLGAHSLTSHESTQFTSRWGVGHHHR